MFFVSCSFIYTYCLYLLRRYYTMYFAYYLSHITCKAFDMMLVHIFPYITSWINSTYIKQFFF